MAISLNHIPEPTVNPGFIPFSSDVCVRAIKIGPSDTASSIPERRPSINIPILAVYTRC